MAKKLKVLGPANDSDVPEDEMHLAMLIQNAASRRMASCREVFAIDSSGHGAYQNNIDHGLPEKIYTRAVAVCARGAMALEEDTCELDAQYVSTDSGNDRLDDEGAMIYAGNGFTLGAAFEQALRPEDES